MKSALERYFVSPIMNAWFPTFETEANKKRQQQEDALINKNTELQKEIDNRTKDFHENLSKNLREGNERLKEAVDHSKRYVEQSQKELRSIDPCITDLVKLRECVKESTQDSVEKPDCNVQLGLLTNCYKLANSQGSHQNH